MINANKKIERFDPDINYGLSDSQLKSRIEDNLVNSDSSVPTKTVSKIISENIFTLFNVINILLAAALIYVGSYKNLLFMGVVISNIIIGTFQEIRAKRTVDKLSIIFSTKVRTIRNGSTQDVNIYDIVLDDIIELKPGNQIVTDCILLKGNCDVNESLITGESDSINKSVGDMLLSGSFVVSGSCIAKVEHIGEQNYASEISSGAKYIKKINSEIMYTLKKIIKIVSILIIPISILLFYNQLTIKHDYQDAVVNTVAALIGMIPEGLVLLTSTVLAVSIIRLSRYNVLVQELYCIETLARVDILCLDKTGTITTGDMHVSEIVAYGPADMDSLNNAVRFLACSSKDCNATVNAVRQYIQCDENVSADEVIPFSSEKKWSGAYFNGQGSYILGAAEFILDSTDSISEEIERYSQENRVLTVVHSGCPFRDGDLPENLEVLGFILIKDTIREEAKETLSYFKEQGVALKVISGDNPTTVSLIAKQAGLENWDQYIDATKLDTDEKIYEAVNKYTVFGRVSPIQKKKIIIALKQQGHTVAMTGDGVNDVLALKESDCSIAMASGSDAARNISQIVLLKSNFDAMPKVVAEGRRTINNIQRSSSLFLVKTIYSTLLSLIFLFINMPYPFIPIQLTLTSVLTIGIPSFILALEPNKERIKGRFLINVIQNSIPGALTIVINILSVMLLSWLFDIPVLQTSTLCVILTGYTGFLLLYKISSPFNIIRKILFGVTSSLFVASVILCKPIFSLADLDLKCFIILLCLSVCSIFVFRFIGNFFGPDKFKTIKSVIYKLKIFNKKST